MNKENLELLIEAHNKDKVQLEGLVKEYVQNKNNPLDDRWDIFNSVDFGEDKDYIEHFDFPGVNENNEYYQRHETITIDRIEDQLFDTLTEENCEDGYWEDQEKVKEVNRLFDEYIKPFREEVLQKYIKSYKFDW